MRPIDLLLCIFTEPQLTKPTVFDLLCNLFTPPSNSKTLFWAEGMCIKAKQMVKNTKKMSYIDGSTSIPEIDCFQSVVQKRTLALRQGLLQSAPPLLHFK